MQIANSLAKHDWLPQVAVLALLLCSAGCRPGSPYDPARCRTAAPGCDLDSDGVLAPGSGGADCDDTDPLRYPGAAEVPYDGIDQDCDLADLTDVDGDGADAVGATPADCDDDDPAIHPGAFEAPLGAGNPNCTAKEDYIYHFAGDGTEGYNGDSSPATQTRLSEPRTIVPDGNGGLLIADTGNLRIRHVGQDGMVRTIAGNGESGYYGDTGPATEAQLAQPVGLALDAAGYLYIADGWSSRIRRIAPDGIITTWAGSGDFGDTGDGGPATEATFNNVDAVRLSADGDLFVVDSESHRVRRIDSQRRIDAFAGTGEAGYTGDGGPATLAQLRAPSDVAFDLDGGVYISDTNNHCIRRVDSDLEISTIAGDGQPGDEGVSEPAVGARLNIPHGLAVDLPGNLYIADTGNNWIRKLDGSTGLLHVVVGIHTGEYVAGDEGDGIPASRAVLDLPAAVAIDALGRLFLSDSENHRIKVTIP